MPASALDGSIQVTASQGTISVLVTTAGSAGHSLIAIEYLEGGRYVNVVADLLPRLAPGSTGRADQSQLISGATSTGEIRSQIRIREGDTIASKVGQEFRSKTWGRPVEQLNAALLQIGLDASSSENTPGNDPYANSPYKYKFFGQPTIGSRSEDWAKSHGLNCGNWVRKILELAGVNDRAGMFLDIPRFQTQPDWRPWAVAFALAAWGGVFLRARL